MSSKVMAGFQVRRSGHGRVLKPGEHVSKWAVRLILIVFVLATIYPMLFVLLTSGKTTNDFYNNIWGLPQSIEWSNYSYAWTTAGIGRYFVSSIIVVISVVVVTLVLSALAGYALAKLDIPKADTVMIVIFMLTMLPSESVLMPMYLMTSKMGILGTHLSLILPYIGWGMAFAVYIYRNFFKTVLRKSWRQPELTDARRRLPS
ncbi:glycerol-3-phosphate transporter membrane protein [[Eubacterium] contortum]|uniref:Glycerol-3-phosphate transporter membrane protein n=1 Tax=Faecalicatena contorta TaxID=39482 RepID=A0A174G709_9FIRM|nr:carbohydrate ABC transporter permease [Faecalicatena contorta]CUO58272.1 glycerol-3-phosphate transporter membrane protein [[Eubacterium] contortum] [Faecalicatena contorta]